MFCQNCGKEISNQAKFCNFCGASTVNTTQPEDVPAAQPPQRTETKKNGAGRFLLTAVIALVVFFAVRTITEQSLTNQSQQTSSQQNSSGVIELKNTLEDPTTTCYMGALYENDTLTYGSARLSIPGYTLYSDSDTEGDWLISPDGYTLFRANRQLEVNLSYDASTEDVLLDSFANSDFDNASIAEFSKYEVNGYPVIRYILECTYEGIPAYIAELIVFPNKTPSSTMRFEMQCYRVEAGTDGYSEITSVYDSLDISSAYKIDSLNMENMGLNRINVK